MPITKEQAKKNIARLTGLSGKKLDAAAEKFVRRQRGGKGKKRSAKRSAKKSTRRRKR